MNSNTSALFAACKANDIEKVKQQLDTHDVDVNSFNKDGATCLHIACVTNNIPLIDLLITRGANIYQSTKNDELQTPLHMAVATANAETLRYLLSKGAHLDQIDGQQWTPLTMAVLFKNMVAIKFLLQSCASCKNVDRDGRNVLHIATKSENEEDACSIAKLLFQNDDGGICLTQDRDGRTPLHYATKYNRKELAGLILMKNPGSYDIVDSQGNTPLMFAQSLNYQDMEFFLQQKYMCVETFKTMYEWHVAPLQKRIRDIEEKINK
jgi:ankyrin repeat protein